MNRREFLVNVLRVGTAVSTLGVTRMASSPMVQRSVDQAVRAASMVGKLQGSPGRWFRIVPRTTTGGKWVSYEDPRIGFVYRIVKDGLGRSITEFKRVSRGG